MIGKINKNTGTNKPEMAFDPGVVDAAFERFRMEQDISRGVLAGSIAMVLAVVLWAAIVVKTGSASVWMGMGVAVLTGLAIRKVGKGIDERLGLVGALLTMAGCALGRLFAICHFIALKEGKRFLDVLLERDPGTLFSLLTADYTAIDLMFYGFIAYTGYRLSFRQFSDAEIIRALETCRQNC